MTTFGATLCAHSTRSLFATPSRAGVEAITPVAPFRWRWQEPKIATPRHTPRGCGAGGTGPCSALYGP